MSAIEDYFFYAFFLSSCNYFLMYVLKFYNSPSERYLFSFLWVCFLRQIKIFMPFFSNVDFHSTSKFKLCYSARNTLFRNIKLNFSTKNGRLDLAISQMVSMVYFIVCHIEKCPWFFRGFKLPCAVCSFQTMPNNHILDGQCLRYFLIYILYVTWQKHHC